MMMLESKESSKIRHESRESDQHGCMSVCAPKGSMCTKIRDSLSRPVFSCLSLSVCLSRSMYLSRRLHLAHFASRHFRISPSRNVCVSVYETRQDVLGIYEGKTIKIYLLILI